MTDGFAGSKVVNTFVAGLVTEAGPLTFPENASLDEDNCVLKRKGNRRRRKGADYEANYVLSTATVTDAILQNKAIKVGVWKAVAGNGTRNFAVLQINKTLYFYNLSAQALSTGLKSFTVDIGDFVAPGAVNVAEDPVAIASGKGLCFISGKSIDPFYITFNSADDTITTARSNLLIRDFDGLDDGLEPDEEPTSLSDDHSYNLKNQGWASPGATEADPTTTYFTGKAAYPGNNKQWWTGKDSNDIFQANLLARYEAGNTLAPRGRFLLDPLNKDRATVSGITGLAVEKETNRPSFVEFFAGRAWYIGIESETINGHVFFSQVITTVDKVGKCYQESDPTTEDLNELLDNDGGVIVIPEIGTVKGTFVTDRFLVIFADNGVWSISGSGDDSFKATNFAVNQVSSVGCSSGDSIVNAAGVPYYWSEDGIYRLQGDQVTGRLTAQSMTQQTIETYYLETIPSLSKAYARGVYDEKTKRIFWHWASSAPVGTVDRWKFNKVIIFDTSFGIFYPWEIKSLATDSPYIAAGLQVPSIVLTETTTDVTDSLGVTVTDSTTADVTSTTRSTGTRTVTDNTYIKWLIIAPTADANQWTFGEFNQTEFLDWKIKDSTGIDAAAFLETGYETGGSLRPKQAPYIVFYFERIEAVGATTSAGGMMMQARWNWSDDADSGKYTTKREIYPIKHQLDKGIISVVPAGNPVVTKEERVRGKGRALSLRLDSEPGKDFNIYGWEYITETQPEV